MVDAFDADDRFDNNLDSKLTVQGPLAGRRDVDGAAPSRRPRAATRRRSRSIATALSSCAPSTARTEDDRAGSRRGQLRARVQPVSARIRELRAESSLARPRRGDDGRSARSRSRRRCSIPPGDSVTFHQDLWPRFVGAAIVLFVLDLLVRRVRLFDRKFLPKVRPV